MTDTTKTDQMLGLLNQNKEAQGGFWKGLGKTATDHLNPFNELHGQPRRIAGFARIGGVGVGGVMVMDGIFRDKTGNGEDRSVITRFGEIILGSAAILGSALAGKAVGHTI